MADGQDASVQLPDTSANTGPKRHVRTLTNALGDAVFEDVVQLHDAAEAAERRANIERLLARLVWLMEQQTDLDSSDITVEDVLYTG